MMLSNLSKQYFSMYPVKSINLNDVSTNSMAEQVDLLLATLRHPLNKYYPPSVSYRKHFLKSLISVIEDKCNEVLEDLYTEYTSILSEVDTVFCFKTYFLPDGMHITLQESTNLISDGTTGLITWQAAQCLSEWIMEKNDLFTDKHVLELGSGLGLTGLTVCKQCHPSHFIFSDCHPKVLSLLKRNISHNLSVTSACHMAHHDPSSDGTKLEHKCLGKALEEKCQSKCLDEEEPWCETDRENVSVFTNALCGSVEVWQLNWETISKDVLLDLTSQVDVILAADVVYDETIIPALVNILSIILHNGSNQEAYIASTIRNKSTRDSFISTLEMFLVSWEVLDTSKMCQFCYDRSVPVEILRLWIRTPDKAFE